MISYILDLFFPRLCALCLDHLSDSEECICFQCHYQLPRSYYLDYRENPVAKHLWGRVNVEYAASLLHFRKGSQVQNLLHLIKYKKDKELGIYMGVQMGIALKNSGCPLPDMVIPVPLHPQKELSRGYNQSALLAEGISAEINARLVINNLIRVSHSSSQTKKSRFERWQNVETAFGTKQPAEFANKHLLLVDDVFTTGATLEACILALSKANPSGISTFTLASAR